MDKQKQIEEMAKDLHKTHAVSAICAGKDCNHCKHADLKRFDDYTCIDLDLAEELYNAGYRKVPENAVVLTREEYERLLKEETLCERLGNDIDVKLKYIYELEDKVAQARKETAVKFAERLKCEVLNFCGTVEENGYFERGKISFCEDIDKICKEITEGKNEKF